MFHIGRSAFLWCKVGVGVALGVGIEGHITRTLGAGIQGHISGYVLKVTSHEPWGQVFKVT